MVKRKSMCWNAILRDGINKETEFRVCAKNKSKALQKAIKETFKRKDMALRLEKT